MKFLFLICCILLLQISAGSDHKNNKKLTDNNTAKRLLPKDRPIYRGEHPKNSNKNKKVKRETDDLFVEIEKRGIKTERIRNNKIALDVVKTDSKVGQCPDPKKSELDVICGLFQCEDDRTCFGTEKCVSFSNKQ